MRQPEVDLQHVRSYLQSSAALAAGGRLPPERELSERLGLTRNRLRGSLRRLAAEGLIWRGVGKGTFLGKAPATVLPSGELALSERTSPREVLQARLIFEPELARLAALGATIRDHVKMRECVEKMRTVKDFAVWGTWDERLHRTIAEGAGSVLLQAMFETLQTTQRNSNWGRLRERLQTAERRDKATQEHAGFVEAICERDAEKASLLMRRHIEALEKQIFTGPSRFRPEE